MSSDDAFLGFFSDAPLDQSEAWDEFAISLDSYSTSYTEQHTYHQQDLRRALEFANIQPGESVLDVGCADGILTDKLVASVGVAGRVHGVDFSREMIRIARAKARGEYAAAYASGRVAFSLADMTKPAEMRQFYRQFDVVLCIWTLNLLAGIGQPQVLSTLRKCLKPGGRLVVDIAPPEPRLAGYSLVRWNGAVISQFSYRNPDDSTTEDLVKQSAEEVVEELGGWGDSGGALTIRRGAIMPDYSTYTTEVRDAWPDLVADATRLWCGPGRQHGIPKQQRQGRTPSEPFIESVKMAWFGARSIPGGHEDGQGGGEQYRYEPSMLSYLVVLGDE